MTRKFTLLLIFKAVLFSSIAIRAQEVFIKPASKLLTNFPFKQFSGGVILVTATVNDYPDSLNFIFDTGSGGISLDSTTCALLHIQTMPSDKTIRGIGGIRTVSFVNNAKLHLPGLTVDSLDFHVNDYDILSGVYGIRIDGIIGYSFLSRFIVRTRTGRLPGYVNRIILARSAPKFYNSFSSAVKFCKRTKKARKEREELDKLREERRQRAKSKPNRVNCLIGSKYHEDITFNHNPFNCWRSPSG